MADFTLSCVDVHFERILMENAEGGVMTSTDTLQASSSDDTMMTCTLGSMPSSSQFSGQPARVITPVRQPRTGDAPVVCTVSDTTNSGVAPWTDNVTLGPDNVTTQIVGDQANVTLVQQALPPA